MTATNSINTSNQYKAELGEIKDKDAKKLESSIKKEPHQFRDPRQKERLEIANRYMGLQEFDKADQYADRIMNAVYITNKRPLFYDEAVFLRADVSRIKGYKLLGENKAAAKIMFFQSFIRLYENYKKLLPLEYGYKSAYSMKMLQLYVEYKEIFKEDMENSVECQRLFGKYKEKPYSYKDLLDNATEKYNRYNGGVNIFNQKFINDPINKGISSVIGIGMYNDNFIFVRSKIAYVKYLLLEGKLNTINQAKIILGNVIKFIDSVNNTSWNNKIPRINEHDWHSLEESIKREDDKFEFPIFYQYEPKNFLYFKSQALYASASIEIFDFARAQNEEDKRTHLNAASNYFSKAHKLSEEIRAYSKVNFYTGAKWEERKGHCDIALEYAKWLLINGEKEVDKNKALELKNSAKKLLEDILYIYNLTKDPLLLRDVTEADAVLIENGLK